MRGKPRSVRAVLALFAVCLVVPATLVIGAMVAWNVLQVRRYQEAELLAVARSASTTVDLKITRVATIAAALSTSDTVMSRDWDATRARVARFDLGDAAWVAITDGQGRRLLNTSPLARADGAVSLPRSADVEQAARSDDAVISDLFTGSSTGRKVVAVSRGVAQSDDRTVVTVVVDPGSLLPSRSESAEPPGAIVTIVDRAHRVVARSRNHDRWQGVVATPQMIDTMRRDSEGVVDSRSLDGDPTVVAYARSPLTGWTTMVVVPRQSVLEPAIRNGLAFVLGAAVLLALGAGLSRVFGQALIRELHLLGEDAAQLGHGDLVRPRPGGIENINRVQAALSAASRELELRASRQQLMINELNHRVKNTLATVQSLAVQTFRHSEADAPAKFDNRLAALAGAHDLLTQTSWEPVDIRSVVDRCAQMSNNIVSTGPSAILPAQTALALCMCLHELQSNAAKYGALSVIGGKVFLSWTCLEDGEIEILWREEDGPAVVPPQRSGFGTRLIDRLASTEMGGAVSRTYAPEGLSVKLTIAPPNVDRWSNNFG